MARRFDAIDVVEQAYRIALPPREWLVGLANATTPDLDLGCGVSFGCWRRVGATIDNQQEFVGSIAPDQAALLKTLVTALSANQVNSYSLISSSARSSRPACSRLRPSCSAT